MPISNKSSQKRMTTTTIRLDPNEAQRRQQTQRTTITTNNNNDYQTNTYSIFETPPLYRDPSPVVSRGSPRMFRVKRVSRAPQSIQQPLTPPERDITTKRVVMKETTSRGTTPPPTSFFDTFPTNQSVYYPTSYQMRGQQAVSTVRYRTPSPLIHQTATSEVFVQQPQPQTNTSTTTKTSTRILDATTIPSLGDDSIIEETRTTTTIIKPLEIPTAPAVYTSSVTTVPQVTTTTVAPAIETTTIRERPLYRTQRRRRIRTLSTSPFSDYTTSSTSSYTTTRSTVTPQHHVIKQHTILPPRPPIQTTIIDDPPTAIVPERRFIHRARRIRTYSGYYSSDLDHGKRKVYKSDYKYRHYYYCNWCKGRCDLPNSSCGCCEWFYGCPLWSLILLGLLFLALIITFFTLLGLQPTINPARRSATAETGVLNRTQIIYGFLQNCGAQAIGPTTLALCSNTQTTSTSRIASSTFYITSQGRKRSLHKKSLISFGFIVLLFCKFQLN